MMPCRDFPGDPGIKTAQGEQVRSLVRKDTKIPHAAAKKNKWLPHKAKIYP